MNTEKLRMLMQCQYNKNGSTYYKVQGDGVIVVIRFEYERVFRGKILKLGLHSMFTAFHTGEKSPRTLVTDFPISAYTGRRLVELVLVPSQTSDTIIGMHCPDECEQIDILREKALPRIERIRTQNELVKEIINLERVEYRIELTNIFGKVAPYLVQRKYAEARQVLHAIIMQHKNGMNERQQRLSHEEWERYLADDEAELQPFRELIHYIDENDVDNISRYLVANYQRNCGLFKYRSFNSSN